MVMLLYRRMSRGGRRESWTCRCVWRTVRAGIMTVRMTTPVKTTGIRDGTGAQVHFSFTLHTCRLSLVCVWRSPVCVSQALTDVPKNLSAAAGRRFSPPLWVCVRRSGPIRTSTQLSLNAAAAACRCGSRVPIPIRKWLNSTCLVLRRRLPWRRVCIWLHFSWCCRSENNQQHSTQE